MTESQDVLRVGLLAPIESLDPRGAWGTSRGMANQANFSRWRWPAADEVLRRLRGSQDDRDRVKLLRDVGQQVPVFPLLYGPATAVHSWRLGGFTLSPIGDPSFAEMGFRS